MGKFIMISLLAAMAAPTAVAAQSAAEIRRDQRVLQAERRDLQQARQYGSPRDVQEERRDVQRARQELREDRQDRRQAYAAPYRGWTYRQVAPGYRLQPSFYSQRYFIANPARYRLPPAARNQQWIRYGDDLLLVNARNGRVLQVYRNRY